MVSTEAHESLRSRSRPAAQAGYNLVFLIALFTLMSVMLTAALPVISTQIRREREAELIFRGLQYAEGIRVFQQRFGRFPNTLEELIELEPRSIRQLWADPMTENGRWALVLASSATQPGAAGEGEDEDEDGAATQGNVGRELGGGSAPTSNFSGPSSAGEITAGPIMGVVTRQKGKSLRSFLGKDSYEEWRFTANILPTPKVVPGTEIVASGSVENLGKPFPRGLTPQGVAAGAESLAGGNSPRDLFGDDDEDDG